MKSGLGDRNNSAEQIATATKIVVSMKSGLGDRNNPVEVLEALFSRDGVSMKSGLGDRNNRPSQGGAVDIHVCLNEVRSWRPEQCPDGPFCMATSREVSMKSGLGDRNNGSPRKAVLTRDFTKVCERSVPQAPATPLC